jgi:hypothetical protein
MSSVIKYSEVWIIQNWFIIAMKIGVNKSTVTYICEVSSHIFQFVRIIMTMTTLTKASQIQKYSTKRTRYTLSTPWPTFRPSSLYKSLPQLYYRVPEAAITCHDLSVCVDVVLSTSASCLGISTLPGVSQAQLTRSLYALMLLELYE